MHVGHMLLNQVNFNLHLIKTWNEMSALIQVGLLLSSKSLNFSYQPKNHLKLFCYKYNNLFKILTKYYTVFQFTRKPFVYNSYVNYIPYASKHVDYRGQCLASGFGRISNTVNSFFFCENIINIIFIKD